MSTERTRDHFAVWGERIALGAAVLLTAKGEFDLAVLAHFAEGIAWVFPVMIDVYVIISFHKRRWIDVLISLALMIFCQAAVHLVPVFITPGEQVPWGLVMAVACIAPIVVVRVKALTGKTRAEIEAEKRDNTFEADARKARVEAADADRKRAEAEARAAAEAEARAAAEAEVEAEAERRKQAEAEVAAEAEARAEVERKLEAEVERLTADTTAAERHHRQEVDEAKAAARDARREAAEQSEIAARIAGHLEESRLLTERAMAEKVNAEQKMAAVTESREAVAAELQRVQQALAWLQQKAEAEGGSNRRRQAEVRGGSRERKQATTSGLSERKQMPELPPSLPVELPPLDGVSPEVAARILVARDAHPEANRKQLAEIVGVSDKTIRNVLNHPALTGSKVNGHDFRANDDTDRSAV